MTLHQRDKLLNEPMMTQLTDAYMCQSLFEPVMASCNDMYMCHLASMS